MHICNVLYFHDHLIHSNIGFSHEVAAILKKMAAMLDFNLANVVFVFSDPKGISVPNLLLVSLSAIFW